MAGRFFYVDMDTVQVDAEGLPIVEPIPARPADLFTRDPAAIEAYIDEETDATRRHDCLTYERRRQVQERADKAAADAAAALVAAAAAAHPPARNGALKIPVEPKWTTLPFLDKNDWSTVYPWMRVFEALTLKGTITPDVRRDYFLLLPNSTDGLQQDFGVELTNSTIDITDYEQVRNLFLNNYGPAEPHQMLLSECAMKVHTVTSVNQWKNLLNSLRIELRLASAAKGIPYTEGPIITLGITPFPPEKRTKLHLKYKENVTRDNVFNWMLASFGSTWVDPTHVAAPTADAALMYTATRDPRATGQNRKNGNRASSSRPYGGKATRKTSGSLGKITNGICGNCGRPNCLRGDKCAAKGAICNKCGKVNHFGPVCRARAVSAKDTPATDNNK